jgi:hypothetical protein
MKKNLIAYFATMLCVFAVTEKTFSAQIEFEDVALSVYVSPSGDDANPGTEEKSLKTIPRAEENSHEAAMRQANGLTHYFTFDGVTPEQAAAGKAKIKNLAAAETFLEYKSNEPFELTENEFGQKAARIDKGFFETPGFTPENKTFTVEIRFRKNKMGTLTGNDGAKSGTIFGMGDGYWSGMRVTTGYPNERLHFAIGRPQPSSAVGVDSFDAAFDGVWNHLAVTWNGKQMRIYLNGIISNVNDYNGVFTKPNWGFRVGYNDAGVGSVNMDVSEIAVFNRVLEADEILAHAVCAPKFDEKCQTFLGELTETLIQNRNSSQRMNEDAKKSLLEKYAAIRTTIPFSALCEINLAMTKLFPNSSHKIFQVILNRDDIPLSVKQRVFHSLIPDTSAVPLIQTTLENYQKLSEQIALTSEQKQRLDKMIGQLQSLKKLQHDQSNKSVALTPEEQKAFAPPVPREIFEASYKPSIVFHVATNGSANNDGTEQSPFATLAQARNAIRKLRESKNNVLPKGGVEVEIHGGNYEVRETITFEESDSGTADAPIVYRNADSETPTLSGGVNLKTLAKEKLTNGTPLFQKVTDATILNKIEKSVRDKLMVTDLKLLGITDEMIPIRERGFGKSGAGADAWFEVYINGKPQQIARYPNYTPESPNDCFLKTGKVLDEKGNALDDNGAYHYVGTPAANPGVFQFSNERIASWANEENVWLFGYWTHLWAANSHPIAKIDTQKKIIQMAARDGYGYRENRPYYAFNILSEIDVPGEWYLDRKENKLYILPPLDENNQPIDLNAADVNIPIFAKSAIDCKNLSHVTFFGLCFADFAATPFQSNGGERLLVAGCTLERLGCWAVAMNNGKQNGVYGCKMQWLGGGGVAISGGNPKTLERGDCFIENNIVRHFTLVDRVYAPAASLDGVGNSIAFNLFEDSPHHGMRMGGYDHCVEFNRINRVVQESDDQSGIDMWGNPVCRGNVIRYNYWSNIGNKWDVAGQSGIRLDDMISGVKMYGNIFVRSAGGRFGAIQIHGGKDNVAENNLVIDSQAAFSFSPWGEKRWLEMLQPESHFWKNSTINAGIDPFSPPHIERYPDLAELPKNADRNFIRRNIAFVTKSFAFNERGQNDVQENIAIHQSVLREIFSDTDWFQTNLDGTHVILPPLNSGFYETTNFRPLPYEKIGNYKLKTKN